MLLNCLIHIHKYFYFVVIVQARSVLWYLVFIGFAVNYMIRINLNITIVEMVMTKGGGSSVAAIKAAIPNDVTLAPPPFQLSASLSASEATASSSGIAGDYYTPTIATMSSAAIEETRNVSSGLLHANFTMEQNLRNASHVSPVSEFDK